MNVLKNKSLNHKSSLGFDHSITNFLITHSHGQLKNIKIFKIKWDNQDNLAIKSHKDARMKHKFISLVSKDLYYKLFVIGIKTASERD